ncbi:MAG: hypothetical protein HN982_03895 [Candidatus Marinimicrobia bacterium]|nr:hypothetical protein [Candidatus Neomarinimicrobiota bacterium]
MSDIIYSCESIKYANELNLKKQLHSKSYRSNTRFINLIVIPTDFLPKQSSPRIRIHSILGNKE